MRDQGRPLDPEADGLFLAEAYDDARRAYEAFLSTPFEAFTEAEWNREDHLVRFRYFDARDDLTDHLLAHGPVETGRGIYRIGGDGRLAYRLHLMDHIGVVACN